MRANFRGCAIVLAYHRVADLERDPQLIGVTLEHFSQQMAVLAKEHETLTCSDLFGLMSDGKRLPRRAVVVTIDDGYVDNVTHALPILKQQGVPATAFLSSTFIDGDREYWWDELERVLFAPGALPTQLSLQVGTDSFTWALTSDSNWDEKHASRWASWNVTQPPPTARHELFNALHGYIQPLTGIGREEALSQLREAAGVPIVVRSHNRTLTTNEVRQLDASGLIEIGAHTRTHQALSARSESEQREEILGDKAALESIVDHEVRSFCYPHGGRDKYDATSVRLAREAGFAGACTTEYGIVVPWADRYVAPRCHTENISGPEFRALLNRWFDAGR
jgi:peptidoglycan/xylan/chitin deacetylase (PgdA/CDA1 family)